MGKWARKRKRNTLKDESYRILYSMYENGKGRSKKEDKENMVNQKNLIYSSSTLMTYHKEMKKFINFILENYPEIKRLRYLKNYVNEYIQKLIDNGKSAIAKTLKLDYSDFIETPKRERRNIKRSRTCKKSDHISQERYDFLSKITSSTGLRRKELQSITGEALFFNEKDGSYYLKITKGTKVGRERIARIMGKNKEETDEIVSLFKEAGKMRLLPKIS